MKSKLSLLFTFVIFQSSFVISHAQNPETLPKDSSSIIFNDDPIASMLDSLSRLIYFDKSSLEITPNKYNFPLDSVPNYSDSVYAMRLAKLDAESPRSENALWYRACWECQKCIFR